MGATALAYTQRQAQDSPLWALVNAYGETVERAWAEKFEEKYGPWRPHWRRTLEGFLGGSCVRIRARQMRVR